MKLLLCTGIFPPDSGGPATYTKSLAAALQERGHTVVVLTYANESTGPQQPFLVVRIKRRWFKPWHYFQYYRAVRKFGKAVDVIYAQDPVSAGYPAFLAARGLKKPFALKITGDYSWEQAQGRGLTQALIDDFQNLKSLPGRIARIRDIQLHVARSADLVITPSAYLKKLVCGWGVKEKRVRVVYNAVAPIPQLSRGAARQNLGIKPDEFLILSAGRDVPWKGFAILQTAVREIQQKYPTVRLVILHKEMHATVLKYLKAADVFVLNTAYEGFPHVILEAMAAGCPVLTTRVCGNPEIVQQDVNGLLVAYNDKQEIKNAMVRLYEDKALRERLRKNGLRTLQNFTFSNMVLNTERLLLQCAF